MGRATTRARSPQRAAPARSATVRPASASRSPATSGAGLALATGTLEVGAALGSDDLLDLQRLAGNRAVVSSLPGVVQRKELAPAKGSAKPPGAKPPSPKPVAPGSKLAPRNSYIDLVNAFQDLAAAAVNKGGVGLSTVKFGPDLTRVHRSLLWQVRTTLIQAADKDHEVRVKAGWYWPTLARKVLGVVEEARHAQLPGGPLAAVTEQVAMLNRKFGKGRPGKADPEVETAEDYVDAVNAANGLLWEFSRMGEAGAGIIREEVPGRKDILVSQGVLDLNAKQRAALNGVKFGSDLNKRRRKVMDTLRKALLLARSEAPGSAYRAQVLYRSIQGDLQYMAVRAPTYDVDTTYLKGAVPKTAEALATHYSWVHQDNIRHALTKERSKEEVKTEQAIKKVGGKGAEVALKQMRAVQDLQRAIEVIERSLAPSPDRPGEWILTSGQTVIRVQADQALALRSTAATQLKGFMAQLVKAMVQVYLTYDSIKRGNSSFKLSVLGGLGGASDPGDQESARTLLINQRDKVVYPLVDEGRLVEALKTILFFQEYVSARAKEVGAYDEDLDVGYKRLATIATVVQVALVALVPVAGQAAIATGAGALAVGGTAVVAGGGGAALGETGRQVITGEDIDPTKIGKAAYRGGVIGAGAIAPVATKHLGTVIAGGGTGTTLVGANALAAGTVGAIHSKLGGGSAGEGFVGGAVGSLAGSAHPGPRTDCRQAAVAEYADPGWRRCRNRWRLRAAIPSPGPRAASPARSALARPCRARAAGRHLLRRRRDAAETLTGVGIQPRPPAPPTGAPVGAPIGSETIRGTGIAPRPPATPIGSETAPGTGIAPRPPAVPIAVGPGQTIPGVGINPRLPASPITGETQPGVGIPTRTPAPGSVGSADTQPQPQVRRGTGSADTDRPGAVAPNAPSPVRASAPTVEQPGAVAPNAPSPVRVSAPTVEGAGSALPSSAVRPPTREQPKGRALLPESEVPRDLTPATKPAFVKVAPDQVGQDPKRDITAHRSSTPTAKYAPEEPGRYVATDEKPTAEIPGVEGVRRTGLEGRQQEASLQASGSRAPGRSSRGARHSRRGAGAARGSGADPCRRGRRPGRERQACHDQRAEGCSDRVEGEELTAGSRHR